MTIYYVDNVLGADSNSGVSPALAWASLTKVRSIWFLPGDQILFKRGCVFANNYLLPASGGIGGAPITFGAYGIGPAPVITSSALNTATWTQQGTGNVWTLPVATEPNCMLVNGTLANRKRNTQGYSAASVVNQNDWNWTAGLITLYSTANPNTLAIRIPNQPFTVACNTSYVVFRDLCIEMSGVNGYAVGIVGSASFVTVLNCEVRFAGIGICLLNGTATHSITGNTVHDCHDNGICGQSNQVNTLGRETRVSYNTLYNIAAQFILIWGNYWIVEWNVCRDTLLNPVPNLPSGLSQTYGIACYATAVGEGANNIVRYNVVSGIRSANNEGSGFESDKFTANNSFYGNLAYGNDGPGFTAYNASNITVCNNTFFDNCQQQYAQLAQNAEIRLLTDAANVTTATVKNNVAVATSAGTYAIYVDATTAAHASKIDYNDFYRASGNWWFWNATPGASLAAWRQINTTGAGHDISADPGFANDAVAQFMLTAGSPCANAGIAVAGVTAGQPNMGAF